MPTGPSLCLAVLAHNEAARIAACLDSLPLGDAGVPIHVIVNGSTDATASIVERYVAAHDNVLLHVFVEGGKARSWNRFLFDILPEFADCHIFIDGDAEVAPGSLAALAACLDQHRYANAAAGLPLNGRRADRYRQSLRAEHGLFGDLYALRGAFLRRMKAGGIRLPDDAIGDDGLICALAKTDLADESRWHDARVVPCDGAGFYCAPVSLLSPASWRMQYRRMINYSIRHFQNEMISEIMRSSGPRGLPRQLAELYRRELPRLRPRPSLAAFWFDRLALRKMAAAVAPG